MRRIHDLDHSWAAWLTQRDARARDRLIVHYSALVKFVAGRVGAGLPSSVDSGDLVSAGVFGLIDALERFDPGHGAKFETFAVPRIRGAIYDGLRALDWVPRSVRTKARDVEDALSTLEHRLGREPTDEELAEHLRISAAELERWLADIASTTVGPLDRALAAGAEPRPISGAAVPDTPAAAFEEDEIRRIVRRTMRELPERERLIMALYYDESLTLAEIGTVIGVTESRVSQLHTRAVLHLRSRLAAVGIP
jgi:RNA polymerase sigma factor for flagellar operon FliA